jgi:hypothetical protein
MKQKSWHIDRRTFLRGSGIALGLPFLNGMALKGEDKALKSLPRRAAFLFFPNGVSLPPEENPQHEEWYWYPKGEGRNYTFRSSQEPLNAYRDEISVIQGLSNAANFSVDPHVGPTSFLTTKGIGKFETLNSVSIDQEIVTKLGPRQTQLSSLVLSSVGGVGSISRTFTLSFDQQGKAIPALSNLRQIYERMYLSNSGAAKAQLEKKTHLLNEVLKDAKDLKRRLGKEDQSTLDDYLSSITDLEKKIENDKYWASRGTMHKPPTHLSLDIGYEDVENYIQTMYELIYLAFKADITRVATYQIASESGVSPVVNMSKYVGMSKDLHTLSHASPSDELGYLDWGLWDQFIAKQLALFLKRMKETQEGDGSLLDRCLIFQGSATSTVHNTHNYPLILAGGRAMGHKAGQYVKYVEEENALSNLYVRIANSMGVPIEKFGDSTGVQMNELFS